jgi:hypothetical protein
MMENNDDKQPVTLKEKLKSKFKQFFSQEFFRSGLFQWVLIGALILNAASWGMVAFFIRPVDFPIILHYNVYFGVDVIGAWWQVYFLPLISLIILGINAFLGYLFYKQKERIAAHLLMLTAFIVQVGMAIAVVCLLIINY